MATISFTEVDSGRIRVSHSDIDSGFPFILHQIDQLKILPPGDVVLVQSFPTANRRLKLRVADDIEINTVNFVPSDITDLMDTIDALFPDPDGGTGTPTTNASLLTAGILPDARLSGNIARTADLADVATTGDYNDLINQPAIGAGDVTLNGSQTLTNKTLTSPVINSPTGIVKGDVGLGNVDNTADASKPVSTAQSAAIAVVQSDINAHEALTSNPHSVTKTQVGLGNADNTSDVNKPVSTATQTALDLKADLVGGTVPANQLPAYVDDIEEYANLAAFPGTGLSNKEYYAQDSQITYRWTGSAYAPIGAGVALGETSSTAYRGDRGVIAYDHSLLTTNPHSVTKSQVGLGSADNTADTAKPVSTAQQTALDLKANLSGPTFTGTVAGITSAMVGLGSVDNTADTAKPVSTAQQTALNLKANLASPTFTGAPVLPTTAVGVTQSAGNSTTRLATTAFVTTANNLKANLASPTLTGTPAAPTAPAATNTTQIATTAHVFAERSNTATLTNKTLTSPVINSPTGIVKGDVGLGNVDNTSDANKPVSSAQAAAIAAVGTINSGDGNTLTYYITGQTLGSLSPITGSRALVSTGAGLPTHALTTALEIGYVSGTSSNIQTQINNRSLKSRLPLNALDHATGDGTTDDTTTLNTWLAAGDYLYLGEGTYKISSQLASTSIRTDVTIIAHPNAKIVPTAAYSQSGGAFLKFTNITNLVIEGVIIEGNGAIASPALTTFDNNMNSLLIEDCTNVTINRCYFTDAPKSAIRIEDCTKVRLTNITALNCYNGGTEIYSCTDVLQTGCTLTGRGTAYGNNGLTLGALVGMFFNDCARVRAIGNDLFDWKNTGTKADGCFDVVYLGNIVDTFGKDGLKVQASAANATIKRAIITSNTVRRKRTWEADGSCYIQAADCEQFSISNNIIEGDAVATGTEHGISVPSLASGFTCKNGIISNNVINSVGYSGLNLEKTANLTIEGNQITDYSTAVTGYFGIHFYTSANNCKVVNNIIRNTSMPSTNSSHAIYCENVFNMDIRGNTIKNSRLEGIRIRPAAGDYINVCDNVIESTNDVALYIFLLNGAAVTAVTNIKINGNTFAKNCLTASTKAVVIYTGNLSNDLDIDLMQFACNTVSRGSTSATNAPLQMYNDGFGSIAKFDHNGNIYASGVAANPVYTMTPTLITEGSNHFRGAGVPEGVITADVGAWYMNITNGNPYAKTSGSGNTGWTAVI